MLTTFKSKADADVLMFGDAAKQLLALLGKDENAKQGIMTLEQLPDAVKRLEAAIEIERAQESAKDMAERETEEEADIEAGRIGMAATVNLAQRAWPLLDLMRRSLAAHEPVIWEAR
ncbi:MAG: DUF1840 domain-containing protein [Azoarcus sp.]|jgi:hypothetical protein|nr:DUF1840 domain-containing protein [Azoarcus sp.]